MAAFMFCLCADSAGAIDTPADVPAASELCKTITGIEKAYRRNDFGFLKAQAHQESPDSPERSYTRALANYRIALLLFARNRKPVAEAKPYLKSAKTLLLGIAENGPYRADSLALLSAIYGLRIAISPMSGMRYGPKSGHALKTAMSLEPENPRVLMLSGTNKARTPSRFGGDKDLAVRLYASAITAFAKDDSPICWGQQDAYEQIIQLLLVQNRPKLARQYAEQMESLGLDSRIAKKILTTEHAEK